MEFEIVLFCFFSVYATAHRKKKTISLHQISIVKVKKLSSQAIVFWQIWNVKRNGNGTSYT